ncbi:DUF6932 family protein [Spiribacter vilamensis]|uniref:Uncharacterized protein n=1 Tax=Spiribacter vilamensis TaxID=531306 RepID=A0A4Q8CZW6_9GAMM|nr:hypothetical protein [Spiribacter vilamensis]RZU98544.1 hypothetical protein EV698_0792 [Spiribacter vilamensis]TVO60197.1 hypothetical protein FPL09_10240 [Spiribacter vilamensis]
MIPNFNHSGVLPPFLPEIGPTDAAAMAPFRVSITDLVSGFAGSPERDAIMRGLLDYRAELVRSGIQSGFQWIAGSFVEDCESNRNRSPADVDIVTFARRPPGRKQYSDWAAFCRENSDLFKRSVIKANYSCDAFFIDLEIPAEMVVSYSRFWFGLFSHQRETYLWKGILQVPLVGDDSQARELVTGGSADAP